VRKKKAKLRERKKKPATKANQAAILKERFEAEFAQAVKTAHAYVENPERLQALFDDAAKEAATMPKEPFAEMWPYFQAMLRLIRAYYRREYRNVSLQNLVMIVGAIIYILNPFDLIPDWIAGLGFADDAVVLAFAVRQTRQTLDDFMAWEIGSRDRPAP